MISPLSLFNPIKSIVGTIFGRVIFTFDRNSSNHYWHTPDYDDNRNVYLSRNQAQLSYTVFSINLRIYSTYDVMVHAADVFLYDNHRWLDISDSGYNDAQFAGPGIAKYINEFRRTHPRFTTKKINKHEATTIQIPTIGCFRESLTKEESLIAAWWKEYDNDVRYFCVAINLHVNSKFLFLTCLIPEWMGVHQTKAYFIGPPIAYRRADKDAMFVRAEGNRNNIEQLGYSERVEHYIRVY
jgi:hypothetical protein